MKEASPAKFYMAKYFFLAFGLLQWLISGLILYRYGHIPKSQFTAFVFFTMGLVFVSLWMVVSSKIRRVAVGKKKIIIHGRHEKSVEWPEVKSLKSIPHFNMYRMKIKGEKDQIYFFPYEVNQPLFGLFPTSSLKKEKGKD